MPLNVPNSSHLSRPLSQIVCCVTATPGAPIAICGPREENHAMLSFESVALTAMTPRIRRRIPDALARVAGGGDDERALRGRVLHRVLEDLRS